MKNILNDNINYLKCPNLKKHIGKYILLVKHASTLYVLIKHYIHD